MRIKHCALIVFVIVFLGIASISTMAGEFYLHENNQYWWYINEEPSYFAVVPNDAEKYITKSIFGYDFLEISWNECTVIMEIGSMPSNETSDVVDFVAKRWEPLLKDKVVFANWEITTSNDLKTFFYGIEGVGPNGKKSMLRSVYFQRDGVVVYLALYIPSNQYQGAMRNHWLRAVNEFAW